MSHPSWFRRRSEARYAERLVPVAVALAHDQSPLDPEDLAKARVEFDTAGAGAQPDATEEGENAATVYELERRVVEKLPGRVQVDRPLAKAGVTAIDARHPGDEPLTWRVVVVVVRKAHEAQIKIAAYPRSPAR
jgi:hypothetical protein